MGHAPLLSLGESPMRFALPLVLLLSPLPALAHGVEMTVDQAAVRAGAVHLSFILQEADGSEVTDQELAETMTRKLHFQLFDEALTEYRHVHPEYVRADDRWEVDLDLPVDGS